MTHNMEKTFDPSRHSWIYGISGRVIGYVSKSPDPAGLYTGTSYVKQTWFRFPTQLAAGNFVLVSANSPVWADGTPRTI